MAHAFEEGFFRAPDWVEGTAAVFGLVKPCNDFVNYTIDGCE